MSDSTANVYSEAQHFALLESAVERETAKLAGEKDTIEAKAATLESEKAALADELTQLKSKADVLEAEKAAAEARAEAASKEFADFKADLARKAEVAEKQVARVDRVKAANSSLGEGFFTQERAQRWAEMTDDAFEALVADMTEAAAAATAPATEATAEKPVTELARESAAFAGGQTSTSTQEEPTRLSQLLGMRRGSAA